MTEPAEPALHQRGPVIDRAHLDRMTGGDRELQLEVLGLVREQASVWTRLLQPDNQTADWVIAAHTIKGSARGIGAWELAELCGAAEQAGQGRALSRDERRIWTTRIELALDAVIDEIARIEHALTMASLRG
jgi:HPt (histidine-containing phosphotransfer) domain-containing protein